MTILQNKKDDKLILNLDGRLDTSTSPLLEKYIESQGVELKELEMDLEKLQYISSAGLRVLLAVHKELKNRDGNLTILNPNEAVREVFLITGFSEILTIL